MYLRCKACKEQVSCAIRFSLELERLPCLPISWVLYGLAMRLCTILIWTCALSIPIALILCLFKIGPFSSMRLPWLQLVFPASLLGWACISMCKDMPMIFLKYAMYPLWGKWRLFGRLI